MTAQTDNGNVSGAQLNQHLTYETGFLNDGSKILTESLHENGGYGKPFVEQDKVVSYNCADGSIENWHVVYTANPQHSTLIIDELIKYADGSTSETKYQQLTNQNGTTQVWHTYANGHPVDTWTSNNSAQNAIFAN